MRLVLLVVLAVATASTAADAYPDCKAREAITLGTRVAAKHNTTYAPPLADLGVCIERTAYPLMKAGGHRLLACIRVTSGNRSERFCGTADTLYKDHAGYRITVSLRTKSYDTPPDVWLQIDLKP
jgi:hypothetical protein